jgi:hypothetical protein
MATIPTFDGNGDVVSWIAKIRAKLVAKGYKTQLLDENRPEDDPAQAAWDTQADKATGVILTYLDTDIVMQFEDGLTPQSMLETIMTQYRLLKGKIVVCCVCSRTTHKTHKTHLN